MNQPALTFILTGCRVRDPKTVTVTGLTCKITGETLCDKMQKKVQQCNSRATVFWVFLLQVLGLCLEARGKMQQLQHVFGGNFDFIFRKTCCNCCIIVAAPRNAAFFCNKNCCIFVALLHFIVALLGPKSYTHGDGSFTWSPFYLTGDKDNADLPDGERRGQ